MVAEETAGVQPPAVTTADALQDPDEDRAVGIVHEDRRVVVPLGADVVVGAGLGMSKRSSHAATLEASGACARLRAALGTLALRTRYVPDTWRGRGSHDAPGTE